MTNEALKALVAEFGDKIFAIILNNNHKVLMGVERDSDNIIFASTLEYKTVAGVDMFGVKHVDHTWGTAEIPYTMWFVTAFIEGVFATDELGKELPDLNKIF